MSFKEYLRTVVGKLNLDEGVYTFTENGSWVFDGTVNWGLDELKLTVCEYARLYIEYKVYCYVRDIEPETIEGGYVIV